VGTIRRLVLRNFKRFKALELEFDSELNILVGGNEAGKSSVLQALDIALSASRSKVEAKLFYEDSAQWLCTCSFAITQCDQRLNPVSPCDRSNREVWGFT
jgi:recombinational DNA repair ATPase RecF